MLINEWVLVVQHSTDLHIQIAEGPPPYRGSASFWRRTKKRVARAARGPAKFLVQGTCPEIIGSAILWALQSYLI